MSAEAWPTEAAATAAVEAAARKVYEISVANHREVAPPDTQFAEYDDLDPMLKLAYREAALPTVWAALQALPDPRHAAWEQGYIAADNGRSEDASPYPSGL